MKTNNHSQRRSVLCSLATAALLTSAGQASADQFLLRILNHDGSTLIPGESAVADHDEWIDVFSFGNSAEVVHNEDGSLRRGEVNQNDFTFHKRIDKSTPLLQQACFTGLLLPAVQIKLNGGWITGQTGVPNSRSPLSVSLNHVQVVAYKSLSEGDSVPTEEVSLHFSEIEWTYIQQDSEGHEVEEVNTILTAFLGTEDPAFDDDNDDIPNDLDNDDDNDGITDDLEIKGETNPFRDDADEDLDGDGQSNLDETIANTRMNDASDYFGIERIRRTQTPEGFQMTVSFPVSGGRHYRLLASPDPSIPADAWIVLDSFHIPEGSPEEGADVQLNPNVLNNASSLFFRVEVSLQSAPLDPTPIDPIDPIAPLPFDPIIPINPIDPAP